VVLLLGSIVAGFVAWGRAGRLPPGTWWIPLVTVILAVAALLGAIVSRRWKRRRQAPQ